MEFLESPVNTAETKGDPLFSSVTPTVQSSEGHGLVTAVEERQPFL